MITDGIGRLLVCEDRLNAWTRRCHIRSDLQGAVYAISSIARVSEWSVVLMWSSGKTFVDTLINRVVAIESRLLTWAWSRAECGLISRTMDSFYYGSGFTIGGCTVHLVASNDLVEVELLIHILLAF